MILSAHFLCIYISNLESNFEKLKMEERIRMVLLSAEFSALIFVCSLSYNNDGMAPQSWYNVKLARVFLHKADCIIIRLLVIWVPVRSFTFGFDVYIMNVYRIFVSTILGSDGRVSEIGVLRPEINARNGF